jgi:probable HAF family extracellular repeat protein
MLVCNRITAFALAGLSLALPATAATYQFTDLGNLGGGYSVANAINDAGDVVGYSTNTLGPAYHPTLWTQGSISDLGGLPTGDNSGWAWGINNAGQIVGQSTSSSGAPHATLWTTKGDVTDLGTLGGTGSIAYAVNGSGQIVGEAQSATNSAQPTSWQPGQYQSPTVLGSGVQAYALNSLGVAVGDGSSANGSAHAMRFIEGSAQDLGTLGGTNAYARGINDVGDIIGFSNTVGDTFTHATLWTGNSIVDLGTLGGSNSQALGINNGGQIVGFANTAFDAQQHATLWKNGSATDLNSVLDPSVAAEGWTLTKATAINNNGWIVGLASNSITGVTDAFLLSTTPAVPEPASYAIALTGLVLLAVMGRRRA